MVNLSIKYSDMVHYR